MVVIGLLVNGIFAVWAVPEAGNKFLTTLAVAGRAR